MEPGIAAALIGAVGLVLGAAVQSAIASSVRLKKVEAALLEHAEYWADFHARGWNNLPEGSDSALALAMTLERIESKLDAHIRKDGN